MCKRASLTDVVPAADHRDVADVTLDVIQRFAIRRINQNNVPSVFDEALHDNHRAFTILGAYFKRSRNMTMRGEHSRSSCGPSCGLPDDKSIQTVP